MIAIVDYGMGNLKSVEKGFIKIGADVKVTSDSKVILNSKGIVLPGVGAFKDCMSSLQRLDLDNLIKTEIAKGKPYLGICLGLQILFSESEEFGFCKGLGILKGRVQRFNFENKKNHSSKKNALKIPHMGWNTVRFIKKPPICEEIPDNSYFYFVHSYYVFAQDEDIIAGKTNYGIEFTSMVWKDNVYATQFHPEKSQQLGIMLLNGFKKICEYKLL